MSADPNNPQLQQALQALLKLAGMEPTDEPIGPDDVARAVEKLQALLLRLGSGRAPQAGGSSESLAGVPKNVLIAGQLGIVSHQLRQNLTKVGASVSIAMGMDEAISEYKNQDYNVVIIDLFMPTEREGLIVLDEIRRTALLCNIVTHVIVLAPPTKDRALPDLCKARGASVFLEKSEGWHKTILQYISGELDFSKDPP